jgi:hypothetical protein
MGYEPRVSIMGYEPEGPFRTRIGAFKTGYEPEGPFLTLFWSFKIPRNGLLKFCKMVCLKPDQIRSGHHFFARGFRVASPTPTTLKIEYLEGISKLKTTKRGMIKLCM